MFEILLETLIEGLVKSGWVIFPLMGASLLGWYMAFHRMLGLGRLGWGRSGDFQRKLAGDDWVSAVENLSTRERASTAGTALTAIYQVRGHGREAMEAKLDEVMKFHIPELEKFLSTLAILASAAPLMGLLGTVAGIVRTFQVISAFGTGNQALMSDSIAESLMATQNGLLVAFPLMLMHVLLANKAEGIEKRTMAAAQALINRCSPGAHGHDGRPPLSDRPHPFMPAPALGFQS